MTKGEDFKLINFQTCDLRVNIYCDGCRLQVKKLLHRIQGVFQVSIGLDNQKVTVVGSVDPAILIAKLARAGKHAELWSHKANPSPNSNNQDYDYFRGKDYDDAAKIQFRVGLELLKRHAIEANNAKKPHATARIPGSATINGNTNHNINNRPGKGRKIDINQPMALFNTPSGIEQNTLVPNGVNVHSTGTSQGGLHHLQSNNNGNDYQPSSTSGFATETGQYDQQLSTFINGYNNQYCYTGYDNQYYECNDPDFSFLVLVVIFIFTALFVLKF